MRDKLWRRDSMSSGSIGGNRMQDSGGFPNPAPISGATTSSGGSLGLWKEEIAIMAGRLGMNPVSDKGLMWIAERALTDPLPEKWMRVGLADLPEDLPADRREPYYFDPTTNQSTYQHPCMHTYQAMLAQGRSGRGARPISGQFRAGRPHTAHVQRVLPARTNPNPNPYPNPNPNPNPNPKPDPSPRPTPHLVDPAVASNLAASSGLRIISDPVPARNVNPTPSPRPEAASTSTFPPPQEELAPRGAARSPSARDSSLPLQVHVEEDGADQSPRRNITLNEQQEMHEREMKQALEEMQQLQEFAMDLENNPSGAKSPQAQRAALEARYKTSQAMAAMQEELDATRRASQAEQQRVQDELSQYRAQAEGEMAALRDKVARAREQAEVETRNLASEPLGDRRASQDEFDLLEAGVGGASIEDVKRLLDEQETRHQRDVAMWTEQLQQAEAMAERAQRERPRRSLGKGLATAVDAARAAAHDAAASMHSMGVSALKQPHPSSTGDWDPEQQAESLKRALHEKGTSSQDLVEAMVQMQKAQRAAMQAVEKFSEEMDQQGTAPPSPAGSEALRSQHAKHEQQIRMLEEESSRDLHSALAFERQKILDEANLAAKMQMESATTLLQSQLDEANARVVHLVSASEQLKRQLAEVERSPDSARQAAGVDLQLRRRSAMVMRLAAAADSHALAAHQARCELEEARRSLHQLQFQIQQAEKFLGMSAHDAEVAKRQLAEREREAQGLRRQLDAAGEWAAVVGIQQQAAAKELARALATCTAPDGGFLPGVWWGPMQMASVRMALDAIVTPPATSADMSARRASHAREAIRQAQLAAQAESAQRQVGEAMQRQAHLEMQLGEARRAAAQAQAHAQHLNFDRHVLVSQSQQQQHQHQAAAMAGAAAATSTAEKAALHAASVMAAEAAQREMHLRQLLEAAQQQVASAQQLAEQKAVAVANVTPPSEPGAANETAPSHPAAAPAPAAAEAAEKERQLADEKTLGSDGQQAPAEAAGEYARREADLLKQLEETKAMLVEAQQHAAEATSSLPDASGEPAYEDDFHPDAEPSESLLLVELAEQKVAKDALKRLVRERVAAMGAKVASLARELAAMKQLQRVELQFHTRKTETAMACMSDLAVLIAQRHKDLEIKVKDLQNERRLLNNRVIEMKGNIRVFCRVRPIVEHEIDASMKLGKEGAVETGTRVVGQQVHVTVAIGGLAGQLHTPNQSSSPESVDAGGYGSSNDIVRRLACAAESAAPSRTGPSSSLLKHPRTETRVFDMDQVCGPESTQADVFLEVEPVVKAALDGYNACIFAYGQTGAGKTHTMEGSEHDRGIMFRAMSSLFGHATSGMYGGGASSTFKFTVTMVEVYNDKIRDLLAEDIPKAGSDHKIVGHGKGAASHEVRGLPGGGTYVTNLRSMDVNSTVDVMRIMRIGHKMRATGATNVHAHSSRSHLVLTVYIEATDLGKSIGTKAFSKLNLVDLAGSERLAKSGATGTHLTEMTYINKSLSALGTCISALVTRSRRIQSAAAGARSQVYTEADNKLHIPYRDCKLTHILSDSLGGDSKTLMFLHVSPTKDDVPETLCSLEFGQRVMNVALGSMRKTR